MFLFLGILCAVAVLGLVVWFLYAMFGDNSESASDSNDDYVSPPARPYEPSFSVPTYSSRSSSSSSSGSSSYSDSSSSSSYDYGSSSSSSYDSGSSSYDSGSSSSDSGFGGGDSGSGGASSDW